MAMMNILRIAGSAMSAEDVRLNVTASNLANANSVGPTPESTYRARLPVFAAVMDDGFGDGFEGGPEGGLSANAGVTVEAIVENQEPLQREFRPGHPQADADGFVTLTNVNTVEEMSNMIAASRAYQNNVEVSKTAKDLMLRTLELGR